MSTFQGRIGLQQRVLPAYRAAFFDLLAGRCSAGMSVFAGQALPTEQITPAADLQIAQYVQTRNLHLLNPSSSRYFCWQPGLIRWLESVQPDALVVEANPRYLSTPRAIEWMHQRGRPVLGWGLGAPALAGWGAGWRSKSRRDFLFRLDGLIAYSKNGAQEYASLGFPPERIFETLNSVDPPPEEPPPARKIDLDGRPVVLFVGRLQDRKRVDMLLQACRSLPGRIQPDLLIVGDGPERDRLERMAREDYPGTTFTGDRRGAELEDLFIRADLFVLPGTGGLAVQQAMRWGLPVIVAQGDGTQDDLVQPENGWLIPPDNLQSLIETLAVALQDIPKLRQMGAASFKIVQESANIERMAEVFIRALNMVESGSKGRKGKLVHGSKRM